MLFDLDGTLTDPGDGFVKSMKFALEMLGCAIPDDATLQSCIGPPIETTFAELLKTSDDAVIARGVALYRERYGTVGLFENTPYPGVAELLSTLMQSGRRIYLATSKPLPYATRIVERFDLAQYFTALHGSRLDQPNTGKAELIRSLLDTEGIDAKSAVMVGDRKHDIIGARQNGVYAVGVTYGYGSEHELIEAGADALYASPSELQKGLCV